MDDDDVFIEPEESDEHFVSVPEAVVVTNYSPHARHALHAAEVAAVTAQGGVVTCEHLLLSLAADPACAAAELLTQCGFSGESIAQTIHFIAGALPEELSLAPVVFSPRRERVLTGAGIEAGIRNAAQVDTLHLLFALVNERKGIAVAALETSGVGHEPVGAALSNALRNGMTDPA